MTFFRSIAYLLLLFGFTFTLIAHADGYHDDSVDVTTAASVDDAVAAVIDRLERQRFEIVGVVNHAAAADSVGLELGPTQVVLFRDLRKDTKLLRNSQSFAIDLPHKVLLWEDDTGGINLKYNAPGYLSDRHDLPAKGLLRHVDRALRQFGDVEDGLVTIDSEQSVETTVMAIEDALLAAGFRIPFVIDHAELARDIRKRLRPTVTIIFGNPNIGTQLMQNSREIALDLPQKIAVWEDYRGRVRIAYNDPFFIARRGGVQGFDTLLGNIANALANFAKQGAMP